MERYGGDFGGYRQGFRGFTTGPRRDYGTDFAYGPGPEDFRGGYYRGGGVREPYGPAFGSQSAYGRDYGEWTGYDVGYRPGHGGYAGERGWFWGTPTRPRARWHGGAEQVRGGDIMTENPVAITGDTPVADAARKMKELNVGIIPVVDDLERRHLQGVITDRDIAIRVVADGKDANARVSDIMTKDVESCGRDDSVRDILDVMQREQVRRIPITDREGRLVGIVAQADLAVDYAGFNRDREIEVEQTIERISEPARPQRGRSRMRAEGR